MKQVFFITLAFLVSTSIFAQEEGPFFDLMDDAPVASKLAAGSNVFANWSYDEFWYPGKIEKIEGDKFFVKFYDNEGEWLLKEQVAKMLLKKGDKVFCKKEGNPVYRIAQVGKIEGGKVFVQYFDDSTTGWSNVKDVRLTIQ